MKQIVLAALALVLCSLTCAAQERAADDPVEVSREEWQARIKAARERIERIRREHRSLIPLPPTPDELAEGASKQVLEDESLRRGDIVSTNRGMFRFEGSPDKERTPDDFVRIPESVVSCRAAAVASSCPTIGPLLNSAARKEFSHARELEMRSGQPRDCVCGDCTKANGSIGVQGGSSQEMQCAAGEGIPNASTRQSGRRERQGKR